MTDEQKNAIDHAGKILRAVKLYDLAAILQAATHSQAGSCDPAHLRIIAESGSVPGMQNALRMVADQLAAARDDLGDRPLFSTRQDAKRYRYLVTCETLPDQLFHRNSKEFIDVAIDKAIAASAPKEST